MKPKALNHKFVEHFPETLQEATLYISVDFATAAHLCCCGCGQEVVTPFSPTDWKMIFDGKTVSLEPSIGNWSFSCRSHYFLRRNKVIWAGDMSFDKIEAGRTRDRMAKAKQYGEEISLSNKLTHQNPQEPTLQANLYQPPPSKSIWEKIKAWFN